MPGDERRRTSDRCVERGKTGNRFVKRGKFVAGGWNAEET